MESEHFNTQSLAQVVPEHWEHFLSTYINKKLYMERKVKQVLKTILATRPICSECIGDKLCLSFVTVGFTQ